MKLNSVFAQLTLTRTVVASVAGGALLLLVFFVYWRPREQASAAPPFEPEVAVRHAFPPIKDAPVVPAEVADRLLEEAELVLGVVIQGQARAYPINMLTGPQREIINDRVGDLPVAATW